MLPKSVRIREVGPREGFQVHKQVVPTEQKIALIDSLSLTGLKEIEITSFVKADLLPQMADAGKLVAAYKRNESVRYSALYLNQKGFLLAEQSGRLDNSAWINTACSDTFLKKNSNTSKNEILNALPEWLKTFQEYGKSGLSLMVSTAFGCSYEGRIASSQVVKVIEDFQDRLLSHTTELKEVCLADTMGWGNPEGVKEVISAIRSKFPNIFLSLHLHDTRGCGLANAYAGMQMGIDCFDSSVGGMGGCPFADGAAGNIATEDLVFMCQEMGIQTGVDLAKLVESAKLAEKIMQKSLSGKIYKHFK